MARSSRTGQTPTPRPLPLGAWLRSRADAGAVGNLLAFALLGATASSRAAHGVLSPAALVAVVAGASVAATTTGWVAGFYEGVRASQRGEVTSAVAAPVDRLTGVAPWRSAMAWGGWAAAWTASGAVVLAAILRDRSAPFPVIVVALLALTLPAAVGVDLAARAAGAAHGAALQDHRPRPVALRRRAWRELALPLGLVQLTVNAGATWMLFHAAAADGTLTEKTAFGDAPILAALLAGLFGTIGQRWGAADAASGRVEIDPEEAAQARRSPLGPQALVYAAILTVVASSVAGLAIPSSPSLLRVAMVRGLLAGGLSAVAVGFAVVRGALNEVAPAVDERLPLLAPAPRRRTRRVAVGVAAATVAGVVLASGSLAPSARSASAQGLDDLGLVAEVDAFAVRAEVDIPLPAGAGSAPHVVGAVRRASKGEAANGIAAAPTHFDAVVGGTVADQDKKPGSGDENRLPQAECSYPGDLVDVAYTFPADLRAETEGAPPIGHSTARCGAGPTTELHAVTATPDESLGLAPGVSMGAGTADGSAGPTRGVLRATASARASGISLLDGLLTVASVDVHGASQTDGRPGGASSRAVVDIEGVTAAGTTFDVRAGALVVGDRELPLDGGAAQAFLRTVSAALAPSGCGITTLDAPSAYPQGFLFSRPEPALGVNEDGSLAGSMTGGLLVQCDVPQSISEATPFSPARIQLALGFVYTGVAASEDIGGFDLGGVGSGTPEGGAGDGLATAPSNAGGVTLPALTPTAPAGPVASADETTGPSGTADGPAGAVTRTVDLLAANFADGRPWVWITALVLWLVLAHRGLERVRREILAAVG